MIARAIVIVIVIPDSDSGNRWDENDAYNRHDHDSDIFDDSQAALLCQ